MSDTASLKALHSEEELSIVSKGSKHFNVRDEEFDFESEPDSTINVPSPNVRYGNFFVREESNQLRAYQKAAKNMAKTKIRISKNIKRKKDEIKNLLSIKLDKPDDEKLNPSKADKLEDKAILQKVSDLKAKPTTEIETKAIVTYRDSLEIYRSQDSHKSDESSKTSRHNNFLKVFKSRSRSESSERTKMNFDDIVETKETDHTPDRPETSLSAHTLDDYSVARRYERTIEGYPRMNHRGYKRFEPTPRVQHHNEPDPYRLIENDTYHSPRPKNSVSGPIGQDYSSQPKSTGLVYRNMANNKSQSGTSQTKKPSQTVRSMLLDEPDKPDPIKEEKKYLELRTPSTSSDDGGTSIFSLGDQSAKTVATVDLQTVTPEGSQFRGATTNNEFVSFLHSIFNLNTQETSPGVSHITIERIRIASVAHAPVLTRKTSKHRITRGRVNSLIRFYDRLDHRPAPIPQQFRSRQPPRRDPRASWYHHKVYRAAR